MAIISWEDINPYLDDVSDGIEAHIPFDAVEFIFRPEDVNASELVEVSYRAKAKDAKATYRKYLITPLFGYNKLEGSIAPLPFYSSSP